MPLGLWHDLHTVFHLSREVTSLRGRVEEMELEWLDKRDALDRLMRRLTMRAVRSAPDDVAPSDPDPSPAAQPAGKDQLRQIARARGML